MPYPKLDAAYQQAVQAGKGAEFLASHPKYAQTIKAQPKNKGLGKLAPDVKKEIQGQKQVAEQEAEGQIKFGNAQTVTALGTSGVTYDSAGNPVYTETLAPEQQKILDAGQQLTQTGQAKAAEMMDGFQKFGPQDWSADRAKVEDAVFANLTRGLNEQKAQDVKNLEDTMYARGIPLSSGDPNYAREMKALTDRYDRANLEARSQATQLGQSEQMNQFSMERGTHQQGLSDMSTLQQQGTGLLMPTNLPGFQGGTFDLSNPTEVSVALSQMQQGNRALNIQQQQVNKMANSNAAEDPFSTDTLPA